MAKLVHILEVISHYIVFFHFQNYMDLSKGHIRALQEGDLSSPKGIEACINASEALLQCMNVALRPGPVLKINYQ